MATQTVPVPQPPSARPGREGLVGWLTSTDHKRIGINTGAAALFFFLLGGLMALTIRAQISQPNNHIVSDHVYTELFTMHGSTMIYLFVTPMALALCMYLVPLQIGAASLAGARVALMGFWIYLIGGLTMESGWLTVGGAGRSGWFSYVPLSETPWTQGQGMNLWVIGVIMAVTGVILMSWCVVVTIARRRAPGMALLRMPPFTWTALVSVLMVLAAFPVLVAAMVMLFLDRTTSAHIYSGFNGIIDYQNFFWFYGHPVVYVMFFPYLGCAVEAIATNARKRWFGYTAFVASMMAFSVLSTSVWGHHMFITGGSFNEFFSFTSTLLI
ncbi:MAG TPA: cbb3-type cytochrome c oxidase subunit I, partial [Solirubrobacteraceae bacterium]|nr:cbb3-type cytochrome c oxidase subunit I [Solirubrobacteraceae bacterium]